MENLDARIRTALVSINPTTKNPAWHGVPTASGVLRGVDSDVAVWRPYPDGNNIREIALHILFWENSLANRLSGERVQIGFKMWKTGWVIRSDSIEESQWKNEKSLLKETRARLSAAVVGFDPRSLDQPLGENTSRPASEFIHGVAEHSLYHTAQIEMIKTLAKQR